MLWLFCICFDQEVIYILYRRDLRHTFTSLLDSTGANPICIDRLVGHVSKSINSRTYTHKDIEELRTAVELIKTPEH